ncbi:MAG: Rrf2 family transcriptional regulator [Ferruginibacter sp.]|nr:Rrf2 family transcriptional regulator [Chitinophagaceae bacterium]MBP6285622.1 Rrf2 family transcriptional regulator [Ferruginibacter sp.]MBU9935337.1 Rrf2 family transcriptional regulator [Ferruginibacter sp.]
MFSKATEYALRATLFLAQKSSEENKMGIEEIARAIDSPRSFTAKILQQLTRGNKVVSSARGPQGGFFIPEKAKQLPVRVVLEAMGEEEILEKCVMGLKLCSETRPCPMHAQYKVIKTQLINLFTAKTIQQLADEIQDGVIFIRNKKS